ncbi:MAG: Methyltransferase type 12 [Chitinophagaceae bacterium]|nr:Methyltransferase type 12 [Chitinophagaceae bacterium]
MMMVYSACPCCNAQNIVKVLSAKDHTVSGEVFEIWQCNICTARFTQGIPDKNELEKYYKSEDYISHSDTKKGLINSMYHFVRKRTLRGKRKLVEKYTRLSTGKILDIGAGTGAYLHIMEQAGWEATGLEPDETARENAQQLYGLSLQPPEELFNPGSKTFDAITLWHVLEHVHDLHAYMGQLKKILKPTGSLFIAVPNYTCYDAKVYNQFWAAYDVPRHLYHFSPASITQLLLQHGLQLKEIKPMWYDSFYVSMLSEKYKTGKNNLLHAAWNGYVSNWKALLNKEKCSSLIYIITH